MFQPRTWWLSSLVAAVTLSLCCSFTISAADIAPALRWVPAGPAATAGQPALIRPSQPARPTPHDDIVSRATLLASEGRWHEIVRLYEPEVRAGGLTPEVRRHYDIASIHCDIERRYGERNFRGKLQKMQEQEASRLYGELLGRIGSHHVDEPDFRQLVERGCLAMETALDDPGFLGFVGVAPSA